MPQRELHGEEGQTWWLAGCCLTFLFAGGDEQSGHVGSGGCFEVDCYAAIRSADFACGVGHVQSPSSLPLVLYVPLTACARFDFFCLYEIGMSSSWYTIEGLLCSDIA